MTRTTNTSWNPIRAIEEVARRFSGKLGLAAKNLNTGEEVLFNADRIFPAASAIKIGILSEVFRQAWSGTLDLNSRVEFRASDIVLGTGLLRELGEGLNPSLRDLATLMIVVSDNSATNMLIERIGGVDAVNRTLRDLGLSTVVLHSPLNFDLVSTNPRAFAEGSPKELMRLCELLANEELVDARASREMLDILRHQQYFIHFPRYFNYNPYASELRLAQHWTVACKIGFFPGVKVDVGVVLLSGGDSFVFCVMVEGSTDLTVAPENEGAIVCGLLGRVLLEYWWPNGAASAILHTPYEHFFLPTHWAAPLLNPAKTEDSQLLQDRDAF